MAQLSADNEPLIVYAEDTDILALLDYGGILTDTQSFALFTLLQATARSSVSG